jgi:plastocyanin
MRPEPVNTIMYAAGYSSSKQPRETGCVVVVGRHADNPRRQRPMPVNATAPRRNRTETCLVAAMSLAILLGACTGGSSPSASHQQVIGSQSEQPSVASTVGGPSLAAPSAPAGVTTVTIRDRSFGAPEITVAVGKVTFINADTVPHTVTEGQDGVAAPNARFDMVVGVGESIQVTFAQPGDYRITCLFHSEMHLLAHAH